MMIYLLYFFILLLLCIAVGIFYFFYLHHKHSFSKKTCALLSIFLILASLGLYQLFGHSTDLKQWYRYGKNQYEFMMNYERLGGITGMIARLHRQLAITPNNVEAWVILGKLYIAKTDYPAAKEAFAHAHSLAPQNAEISHYLDIATNPANYDMI